MDIKLIRSKAAERVGPKGTWWDWDDGKVALEYLFLTGEITAHRRASDFARVYDVTELMDGLTKVLCYGTAVVVEEEMPGGDTSAVNRTASDVYRQGAV